MAGEKGKGILHGLSLLCRVVCCITVLFLVLVEAYLQGFFDSFEKLDTVYSSQELITYIDAQLLEGKTEITLLTKGIEESEIEQINEGVNGFFGCADTFTILQERRDHTKILKIQLLPSDNLFVWNSLVKQKEVALSEKQQKLQDAVLAAMEASVHDSMTDMEKEIALHDYLVSNCVYDERHRRITTNGSDDIYHAYGALVNHKAVCNGYAEAMHLLLQVCGIETRMVVGMAEGDHHAWNMVKLEEDWYHLDATWDDPVPDAKGEVCYTYFNVTDEEMAQTHEWERQAYPVCDQSTYNYFVHKNLVCDNYDKYRTRVCKAIEKGKKNLLFQVPDYTEDGYSFDFIWEQNREVLDASYSCTPIGNKTVIALHLSY